MFLRFSRVEPETLSLSTCIHRKCTYAHSHFPLRPAFNHAFNRWLVLLQSDGIPIQKRVGMNKDEGRRFVCEHCLSPTNMFLVHPR